MKVMFSSTKTISIGGMAETMCRYRDVGKPWNGIYFTKVTTQNCNEFGGSIVCKDHAIIAMVNNDNLNLHPSFRQFRMIVRICFYRGEDLRSVIEHRIPPVKIPFSLFTKAGGLIILDPAA